ncbi:hypothetical protein PAESOLCIP111_02549 [Paenibacillus solanacearum]|uniref:Cold-shock protein n=1 Tax=Paenibacillus solanacearum TaxID=2048548 RepID=A0A916NQE9_9BACL|nr:hypothetical protein PAESOLCIP111_02549 [Paenibacillus solanacearum]
MNKKTQSPGGKEVETPTSTLEQPTQNIRIWECVEKECIAWVREEFVTEAVPACPLCKSAMVRSERLVPLAKKKVNRTFLLGRRR